MKSVGQTDEGNCKFWETRAKSYRDEFEIHKPTLAFI